MKYNVDIQGITPLIMHFYNLAAMDEESGRGKTGGKAGDDRYPADRWKMYAYVDDEHLVLPWENVSAALITAGSKISIGGNKTLKQFAALIVSDDVYSPINVGDAGKARLVKREDIESISGAFNDHVKKAEKLGFELFIKRVGVNGKAHVRVRPYLTRWAASFAVEALAPELTTERVRTLFDVAGARSGVGDWRPSSPKRPGPFGRFKATVTEIQE